MYMRMRIMVLNKNGPHDDVRGIKGVFDTSNEAWSENSERAAFAFKFGQTALENVYMLMATDPENYEAHPSAWVGIKGVGSWSRITPDWLMFTVHSMKRQEP